MSKNHVHTFLNRQKHMTSGKLGHVLRVLGLTISRESGDSD